MSTPALDTTLSRADLLNIKELTGILDVDPATVWRWRTRRRDPLPTFKVGARVFFLRREFEAWFLRQRERRVRR